MDESYSSVFENAPIGIFRFSVLGELLSANPFLLKMLDYNSIEELKEAGINHLFFGANHAEFIEFIDKRIDIVDFATEWESKNGEKLLVKLNAKVFYSDEKPSYYECFVEDISEIKFNENLILNDGLFGQWIFDGSIIPIIIIDFESYKVVKLNEAAVKILGFKSKREVLSIRPEDVSAERQYDGTPSSEKIKYYWQKAINKGNVTFEWFLKKPNGELWDGEVNLLFFHSKGRPMLQLSLIDITERKLAEDGLRKSQQLFKTLAQNAPVGIFRTRPDGYTTYVNPKWTEISGLSQDKALGDGWLAVVHPDDKKLLAKNWKKYASKGKKSKANYRFVKPDGSVTWVLGDAVPEVFDGKIIGYVGTITDITELIVAEQVLRESEEKYRTIIEAFPDIIMISDLHKNILFANDALIQITGIAKEDFKNPDRKPRIHPDDYEMVQEAIADLLESDKKHTDIIENRFIDAKGNVRWFNGIISKLELKGQMVLQTISRDITEKKLVEKELEEYKKQLEILVQKRTEELAKTNQELTAANDLLLSQRQELETMLENLKKTQSQLVHAEKMASLGLLASGIAHEINNPLNFIRGGVYGLTNYFEDNKPDQKDRVLSLLNAINTGIDRAAKIVESLNHYGRQSDSEIVYCNIHSIIDNCLVMLQHQTKGRIDIRKKYTEESYSLVGNEGKLHQAMLNILANAVQAIENTGKIVITTKVIENNLVIHFNDSGKGIEPEAMDKIFELFFTTKEVGKGTGLGLSITQKIILEHKGTVEINSVPGEGTNVTILLPIKMKQ